MNFKISNRTGDAVRSSPKVLRFLLLGGTIGLATGCTHFTHHNKHMSVISDVDKTYGVAFVDVKQRALSASTRKVRGEDLKIFCAEPSPDALSSVLASTSLSFSDEQRQATAKAILGESAASIGLRTQSIQLMRDAMFRICEAYQGGALQPHSVETMLRRFQNTMVAILAIEQLTGAVKAPAVAISVNASQTVSEKLAELSQQAAKQRQEVAGLEQSLAAKTEERVKKADEVKTAKPEEEEALQKQLADLETEEKALDENLNNARKDLKATEQDQAALRNGDTSIMSSVTIEAPEQRSNAALASQVSSDVVKIVESALGLQFSHDVCTTVLGEYNALQVEEARDKKTKRVNTSALRWGGGTGERSASVVNACFELLGTTIDSQKAVADLMIEAKKRPAAEREKMLDQAKELSDSLHLFNLPSR